ncbi:MAG: N-acetylneuraminate synthase family protein [Sedimentisphaerales bacterium]|nr:N-acetylneuraminate synthase family protein [Sedimentisphaerales bacterium]
MTSESENRVFITAEVAQAHDGSLGILHSYIDAIAPTGVDAIKFQVHIAEAESSPDEPFRVHFSCQDKTRQDYWRRVSFSREQWARIKKHCEEVGLEFLASPFSIQAAQWLASLSVKRFKIASGEIDNFLMLDFIRRTGKEIWISTGMSSFSDIDRTLEFLHDSLDRIVLFQCTTAYPTDPTEIGLNVITELQQRYGLPVGFSDHSGTLWPSLAAVVTGVRYVESHLVFDKRMFGPDTAGSLTVDQFTELVKGIRFLEQALAHPVDKNDTARFTELRTMFGKSLAVRHPVNAGHRLTIQDLETKKPAGKGVSAGQYTSVLGRAIRCDLPAYSFIRGDDLCE